MVFYHSEQCWGWRLGLLAPSKVLGTLLGNAVGLQEDEGWGVCKQTNVKIANKRGSKLLRCQVT